MLLLVISELGHGSRKNLGKWKLLGGDYAFRLGIFKLKDRPINYNNGIITMMVVTIK